MNRAQLVTRTRSMLRDFNERAFRATDVYEYLNEAIERCQQVIPEFDGMEYLLGDTDVPTLLPKKYHHLLAIYSASRCYAQDERFHQATTLMNEFEVKLADLADKVLSGDEVIKDPDGNVVIVDGAEDFVTNVYFEPLTIKAKTTTGTTDPNAPIDGNTPNGVIDGGSF